MSQSKRSSTVKRKMKALLFGGQVTKPCCFCRRNLTMSTATLEHVVPLSLGGRWTKDNLRLSCESCNGQRQTEEFTAFQRRKRGIGVEQQTG